MVAYLVEYTHYHGRGSRFKSPVPICRGKLYRWSSATGVSLLPLSEIRQTEKESKPTTGNGRTMQAPSLSDNLGGKGQTKRHAGISV